MVSSGHQDEFVTKGFRDRAAGFQKGLQMDLGRLLKLENGLAPIRSVGMAAG